MCDTVGQSLHFFSFGIPWNRGKGKQGKKEEQVDPPGHARVTPKCSFFKIPFCSKFKQMEGFSGPCTQKFNFTSWV